MDAASGRTGPQVLPLPVGIAATGTGTEPNSLGSMEIPAGRCLGAQARPGSGPGRPEADPGSGCGPAGQA